MHRNISRWHYTLYGMPVRPPAASGRSAGARVPDHGRAAQHIKILLPARPVPCCLLLSLSLSPVLSFPEIFQSVVILFSRVRLLGVASVFELQSAYFLCDTSDRQSFPVLAVASWSLFCLFLRPVVLFFPRLLFSECTSTFFPARFRSLFVFVFGFILLFLCMCVRAHRVGFLASSYCVFLHLIPFRSLTIAFGLHWAKTDICCSFGVRLLLFLVSCSLFDFQRLATSTSCVLCTCLVAQNVQVCNNQWSLVFPTCHELKSKQVRNQPLSSASSFVRADFRVFHVITTTVWRLTLFSLFV